MKVKKISDSWFANTGYFESEPSEIFIGLIYDDNVNFKAFLIPLDGFENAQYDCNIFKRDFAKLVPLLKNLIVTQVNE